MFGSPVMAQSKNLSAGLHCLVSLLAAVGAAVGLSLWTWAGHEHWGGGLLLAACGIIGLWAAVDSIRLGHGWAGFGIGVASMLFVLFHLGALLAFCLNMFMLAGGGSRP